MEWSICETVLKFVRENGRKHLHVNKSFKFKQRAGLLDDVCALALGAYAPLYTRSVDNLLAAPALECLLLPAIYIL